MIPTVNLARSLKKVLSSALGTSVDVGIEHGSLMLRADIGTPQVFLTFRVEMIDESEYEVVYKLAPGITSYSTTKQTKDMAQALVAAAQKVDRALKDVEAFLAAYAEP